MTLLSFHIIIGYHGCPQLDLILKCLRLFLKPICMAVKVQNQFDSLFRICINVACMSIFCCTDRLILTVHLLTPATSSLFRYTAFHWTCWETNNYICSSGCWNMQKTLLHSRSRIIFLFFEVRSNAGVHKFSKKVGATSKF
jgi:hypothetical protein